MTRRLEPQDRINELGNASVPFKFDVHSFIFSQDAVALEYKMHEILNDRRVNKVNMRKEFFKISIDELEKIVDEIEQQPNLIKQWLLVNIVSHFHLTLIIQTHILLMRKMMMKNKTIF